MQVYQLFDQVQVNVQVVLSVIYFGLDLGEYVEYCVDIFGGQFYVIVIDVDEDIVVIYVCCYVDEIVWGCVFCCIVEDVVDYLYYVMGIGLQEEVVFWGFQFQFVVIFFDQWYVDFDCVGQC